MQKVKVLLLHIKFQMRSRGQVKEIIRGNIFYKIYLKLNKLTS
jgi:hypothetical protein